LQNKFKPLVFNFSPILCFYRGLQMVTLDYRLTAALFLPWPNTHFSAVAEASLLRKRPAQQQL
jgi:hypothetical protein